MLPTRVHRPFFGTGYLLLFEIPMSVSNSSNSRANSPYRALRGFTEPRLCSTAPSSIFQPPDHRKFSAGSCLSGSNEFNNNLSAGLIVRVETGMRWQQLII